MKMGFSFFVALFFIACFTARADISVFGNSPSGGSGGLSSYYYAPFNFDESAIGFTPQENINVSSVTLWLSGFNGQNGQNVYANIVLNGNNPELNHGGTATNFPSYDFLNFSSPAPNDGSVAAFTFSNPTSGGSPGNPSGSTVLLANTEYWLVVADGGNNEVSTSVLWATGGTPAGEAVYDGSTTYTGSALEWDTASGLPAFSINIAPEPGVAAIMMVPLLLGAGRKFFKARQPLL